VADTQAFVVMRRQRGQVLVFFAILLPIILLPLGAYAVDAAFVISSSAGLQEATAQAAEAAVQQIDVAALRSRSELSVDAAVGRAVATQALSESEPGASVESFVVTGAIVTITAGEHVTLPFNFLPVAAVKLEAHASARLVTGYGSPSSRLPLPTNTF